MDSTSEKLAGTHEIMESNDTVTMQEEAPDQPRSRLETVLLMSALSVNYSQRNPFQSSCELDWASYQV